MALLDTAILGLYAVAVVFSIIELGLSAYATDIFNSADNYYGDYDFFAVVDARARFLVFASVWTLFITIALLAFAFTLRPRGETARTRSWLAPTTLALNAITMVFWLAGFAAWADLFNGFAGTSAAILAFAILLWLIFLGLLVINALAAAGTLASATPGYTPMMRKSTLP